MSHFRRIPFAVGLAWAAAFSINCRATVLDGQDANNEQTPAARAASALAKNQRMAPPVPDPCKLAAAPAGHFMVRVPFEVVDGRIYVQGRVNQRGPFRLAVDTGASGIGRADTKLVSALGLTATGQASNSDGVQTALASTVHLDSIELGGLKKTGVTVITRDYGSRLSADAAFDGIVGREFFSDGLLILDYPARTLSFSRTLTMPEAAHVLSYEKAFRVPVKIGSLVTEANLDTGANVTMVMPPAVYQQVAQGPLTYAGTASLANTQIETQRAVVPGPFQIGSATLPDIEVRVGARFPEVMVGAHVLQNYAVIIDQRSRKIALCK